VKAAAKKRRRWMQALKWLALLFVVALGLLVFALKDAVRTLGSLRQVPGSNAYVMDYHLDYNLREIRENGMDVNNLEDSCLRTLLPDFLMPALTRLKRLYLEDRIETVAANSHHCSTLALRGKSDEVFFGRNFDWHHDAYLILRIHDRGGCASIAVIDLAYLNLNRPDLAESGMLDRLPLLFAPYYVMDGVNRHGVAVSSMSVRAKPPRDPAKPDIIHSTLMRLVLDVATNVDEAEKLVREFNVHFVDTQAHMMIADATGHSKIVEFIDGEIRVTSSSGEWQLCANNLVWDKTEEEKDALCDRYRTGSEWAERLSGSADYEEALKATRSMSVKNRTMWTSVYNLTTREARILYKSKPETEYRDALEL
jgi:hypothetical protein